MGFDICPQSWVTQSFGCTSYPLEWFRPDCSAQRFHAGLDLGANLGAGVYATRRGRIVANQDPAHWIRQCAAIGGRLVNEPYLGSSAVFLECQEGGRTITIGYGHLDRAAVRPGDLVEVGRLLGGVGTHGASCGTHLHVEVRVDGARQGPPWANILDPGPWLTFAKTKPQEVDDMPNILVTGDQQPDPRHGNGAVYLGVNWPGGPVVYLPSNAVVDAYKAEIRRVGGNPDIQRVSEYVLDDRLEVSAHYARVDPTAWKAELDAIKAAQDATNAKLDALAAK